MIKINEAERHIHFAKTVFNKTWELLEKNDRSSHDDDKLLAAAYTSLYHWMNVGNELNLQRGHWMVSRVQAVLGNHSMALKHAKRCAEFTSSHAKFMTDFSMLLFLRNALPERTH